MTKEQLLAELLKHHNPELVKVEGGMVYELWEDGELTLTKCGAIYRQRGLHTICGGRATFDLQEFLLANFPNKNGQHAWIVVNGDIAEKLSDMINNWFPEPNEEAPPLLDESQKLQDSLDEEGAKMDLERPDRFEPT